MSTKQMPWFRMYTDFLNDPKMISLAFEDQRHFIGLLALKGDGTLDNACAPELMNRIVAQRLWVDFAMIGEVKKRLVAAGLIDEDWQPLAWGKRQMRSDADATNAERQRRHRQKKQANSGDGADNGDRNGSSNGDSNALRNGEVTGLDTEGDTDTEESKPNNPDGLFAASAAADAGARAGTSSAKPPCPHQQVIALYHELLPANPAIRDWTDARAQHLRARWNEDAKRQTLDWWRKFFAYIAKSEFLTGRTSGRGGKPFTPGLDWIVKAENFAKIYEGRFHDTEATV
ncbi:hypothetical protein [Pandoraea apista]|uniref:hypothetical protein n=1 Tax=Pandoraea apista TaxID=93218 RepID=UPI000F673A69|nr:hypothetical protein [Pandoraea apista]RRW90610.1 hypothetical protein EGJ54_21910 [Pandoraea apista]RRX00402.1 hypothetical protein EGJ56_19155 [Pandoraea apista]